jgi:hypothetical protein
VLGEFCDEVLDNAVQTMVAFVVEMDVDRLLDSCDGLVLGTPLNVLFNSDDPVPDDRTRRFRPARY